MPERHTPHSAEPAPAADPAGTGAEIGLARGLLALLTAAAFVIFAQAFMIAPILPRLAGLLHTTPGIVGFAVPAYLIPYGVMTLVWGLASDRLGRRSSSARWPPSPS